jgi:hypothetical protein
MRIQGAWLGLGVAVWLAGCGSDERLEPTLFAAEPEVVSYDSQPMVPLDVYSRVREVDPKDNGWLWTLRTKDDRFVFRAPPLDRLPGEPR